MARIKYSGLISEISGSVAGTTFQRNKYGYTIKQKPNPVRPIRPNQQLAQSRVKRAIAAWVGLTSSQRSAWDTYASTYPEPTRLDPTKYLGGYNLFIKYHLFRFVCTEDVLADPSGAQIAINPDQTILTLDAGDFTWEGVSGVSSGNWYMLLFLSRVVPLTTNYAVTKTRFITFATVLDPVSELITAPYAALFANTPAVGERVMQHTVLINQDNGQISQTSNSLTLVVAP